LASVRGPASLRGSVACVVCRCRGVPAWGVPRLAPWPFLWCTRYLLALAPREREATGRLTLKGHPWWGALSRLIRRRPTLPDPCGPSTIGAERLNCSVRNGKRCIPLAMTTGNCERFGGRRSRAHPQNSIAVAVFSKSRPRIISTGLLNALLRLHIPPINLVVSQDPYSLKGMGELISRWASRLDAFSGYPIQT
jgi:hypothetical protein